MNWVTIPLYSVIVPAIQIHSYFLADAPPRARLPATIPGTPYLAPVRSTPCSVLCTLWDPWNGHIVICSYLLRQVGTGATAWVPQANHDKDQPYGGCDYVVNKIHISLFHRFQVVCRWLVVELLHSLQSMLLEGRWNAWARGLQVGWECSFVLAPRVNST